MRRADLAELAEWAETQMPRLIDDAYAATLKRIDLYRTDEIVPRDDLRLSIAANLRFVIAAIADPQAASDHSAPAETSRRRARQGAPLPEVLQVYRIGFAMVWEALVDRVRAVHGAGNQRALGRMRHRYGRPAGRSGARRRPVRSRAG